jgi:hypothetical protein
MHPDRHEKRIVAYRLVGSRHPGQRAELSDDPNVAMLRCLCGWVALDANGKKVAQFKLNKKGKESAWMRRRWEAHIRATKEPF